MPSAKSSDMPLPAAHAGGLVSDTAELRSSRSASALRDASNARRPHTPAPPRSRRRLCSDMRLQVDRLAIVQAGGVRFAVCVPCKLVLSVGIPRIIEHVYDVCSQPFPRTVPQAQVKQALVAANLSSSTAIAASPYRTPSADPVPALPLYPSTRGFRCLHADCVYFAHEEATMRRHVKGHGTKPALGTTFARCKVQQIAKGKYISVTLARSDVPLSTPLRMTRLVPTSDPPLAPSSTAGEPLAPTKATLTKHVAPTEDDITLPPTPSMSSAEPEKEPTPTMAMTVANREPVIEEASVNRSEAAAQRQVCWPYRFTKPSTQNVIDLTTSPPVVVDLTLSDDESESDFDPPLSPRSYADLCQRARNATDTYHV